MIWKSNEFGFEWAKETPLGLKGNLDHSDPDDAIVSINPLLPKNDKTT